jgi:intracellular sulfur oxidation DsrE/DsrF family protein
LWLIFLYLNDRVSLFRPASLLLALVFVLPAWSSLAQDAPPEAVYYVADIELHTAQEFGQLLDRAEQLFLQTQSDDTRGDAIVTLVLHGRVLRNLLRENYLPNKALVDLAASLSALEVIDVKACQSWMTHNGISPGQLQPFIEVVAYGPAEVERLVQERGYLYF